MGCSRQSVGLLSDTQYLQLLEAFWNPVNQVATNRYYVIDAATARVERYFSSYQAYTVAEYVALLAACGFEDIQVFPSLQPNKLMPVQADGEGQTIGQVDLDSVNDLIAILANKW